MIQKERIKVLHEREIKKGKYVLYWMQASQRAEYNHALEYAILKANELYQPVIVFFGITDRLIHKNLGSNPHAAYLFMESGEKYVGKRLYLTKIKEEKDQNLIDNIRRKESCPVYNVYKDKIRYLVYFHIDKVLPLIGDKK